jgi:hypothetical protein
MRPRIHELLDADVSKMTPDELGRYIERFQAIQKKRSASVDFGRV